MDGITRREISKLQLRALRKGVYHRVLNRMERGLLYCMMRSVDTAKVGGRLWRVTVRILAKLQEALQSRIGQVVEAGKSMAVGLSELAVGWGNGLAVGWRDSREFLLALGLGVLFSSSLGNP